MTGTGRTRPLASTNLQRSIKALREFREDVRALELQASSPQAEVASLKLLTLISETLKKLADAERLLQEAGGQ
jgi:hypothetical protein